jgi:hypothetical protein
MKDDWLTGAPVLVKNLNTILGRDCTHRFAPCLGYRVTRSDCTQLSGFGDLSYFGVSTPVWRRA